MMKNVLTIAGSDCSGGAGIQADLKTFAAHGVYGLSAVTAVVAENTCRVISAQPIDPAIIGDQLDAVFEDIPVDGVKIGMLPDAGAMQAVAARLRQYLPPQPVIDPVMLAKNGCALMETAALTVFIREIVPLAFVLTPNIPEAETLTGLCIRSPEDRMAAAAALYRLGAQHVLIKGGHLDGDAEDLLYDGQRFISYHQTRIPTRHTHGTGCTLSSAIAARLALGQPVAEAVADAKAYVTTAIAHALPIGRGHGPTNHFYQLYKQGGLQS